MIIKIIGGLLVALGCLFRAISLAYFNLHEKTLSEEPGIRRRFAAKKHRALIIDALFVVMGIYLIIRA